MLLVLNLLFFVGSVYGAAVSSSSGRYCADDALQMNWFDAEIYCNENYGGFASFHSESEFAEMEAFSLSVNSLSWNGAYEIEASTEILFSDGTPYDYAVTISNQNAGYDEYGMIWSSETGLTLGLNPSFTTYFVCNCEAPDLDDDDLCPDSCTTISFDGCNKCRCRKNGNTICQDNGCEPTTDRYCMYTDIVREACPENCARYDMGGRECLCKQKKGYMVCEPEAKLEWDLRPHCTATIEEEEAEFNVNGSINLISFMSEHWLLSSALLVALVTAVLVFVYRAKVCAKKGEYQPLL